MLDMSLSLPGGGFGGGRGARGGGGGHRGRGRGRGRGGGRGDRPKVHTDRLGFATGGPAALNSKQRAIKKNKQQRQKRNALHYKATKKYSTDFSQTNAAYRAAFGEDHEDEEQQSDTDNSEHIANDAANSADGGGHVADRPKQLSTLEYERRAYLQARGLDEETRRQQKKEAVRAAAQRHVKKKQRDKARSKLLQRDRRGQPKAKHMIEHLLEKIQATR